MKIVERYNSQADNGSYSYDCLKMTVDYKEEKITTCIFPSKDSLLLVIWNYGNFYFDYEGELLSLNTSPKYIPLANSIFSAIEKEDLDDFKRWMHEKNIIYIEQCIEGEEQDLKDAQDELKEHTKYKKSYEKKLALLKAIPDSVVIAGDY